MAYVRRYRNLSRFLICSSTWIVFLCIHLSFGVQTVQAQYREDWAGYHAGFSRELLSRYTLDGKSTNDRFCSADENGNCDWSTYGLALAAIGLPMLILSLLSLLCLPCFLIFRFCCNLFGGRQPNSGIFCPNPPSTFSGYSSGHIRIIKILVILFVVGICICAIFGFVANAKVRNGVVHTGEILLDTGQFIINECQKLVDLLSDLPYTGSATDTLDGTLDEAQKLLDRASDVRDEINKIDGIRSGIMIASFILPLALVVATAVGGVINLGMIPLIVGLVCFLASSLMWLSGAIHYVVGTGLTDLCKEVDKVNDNGERDSVLDEILPCGDFEDIYLVTREAMDQVVTGTCNATDYLCAYGGYASVECPPVACGEDTLSEYTNATLHDFVLGCDDEGFVECPYVGSNCSAPFVCSETVRTFRECATQCNNTELRSLSIDVVTGFDDYEKFKDILEEFIFPLLNCTYVNNAFKKLDHSMCDEFSAGVAEIGKAAVTLACLLVPTTFLSIMGYKRFSSKHQEELSGPPNYELT